MPREGLEAAPATVDERLPFFVEKSQLPSRESIFLLSECCLDGFWEVKRDLKLLKLYAEVAKVAWGRLVVRVDNLVIAEPCK